MSDRKRIAVALSGGVDSALTAWLLKKEGHEVLGVHMQTGFPTSVESAETVARFLGIPFHVIDVSVPFRRMTDYFCAQYARARTPNPCVVCNAQVKFGVLLDQLIERHGIDLFATGHYVRIGTRSGRRILRRGMDERKDQSYMLCRLRPSILDRLRFPLGEFHKTDVVKIVESEGFPNAGRKESQEICFIPEGNYVDFVRARVPGADRPGEMVDKQGNVLARHPGVIHFTIGQRRGLGKAFGEPRYVVSLDAEKAQVVIGAKEEGFSQCFRVREINWFSPPERDRSFRASVQIRLNHKSASAEIHPESVDAAFVVFDEPQWAITPGQAAVFYIGDDLIGGGWIDSVDH